MQPSTERTTDGIFRLSRGHLHLGVWLLALSQDLLARLAPAPLENWAFMIGRSNLIVVLAFLAIFHILTDKPDTTPADRHDVMFFGGFVTTLWIGAIFGMFHDVAFILAAVSLFYFSPFSRIRDSKFIGLVYLALSINGAIAPLIFVLFKDVFLVGEVQLAVTLAGLWGIEVVADGVRMVSASGMKLHMIAGCSIYSNLSLAILGFISFRAFFRLPLDRKSYILMGLLAVSLILINSLRLGMMSINRPTYEFIHEGNGALIITALQLGVIALFCGASVIKFKSS